MKNKSKQFNNVFFYIFSISLLYFLAFFAFYLVCFFDKNNLYNLIIKHETYKNLPFTVSDIDLKTLCSELMEYISGKLNFLETAIDINGTTTEFYSLRSKIHMADVRNLILTFLKVAYISIAICIISLFKVINIDDAITKLKKAFIKTLVFVLILFSGLIIFASTNFDLFFVKFHQTLFTNDLWLLDPREDYIICLLPEKIFMIYGIRIAVAIVILFALCFCLLQILSKIQPRQEAK